jgi:transcription initiation factor TFIID TATA-box-binding protein
MTQEDVRQLLSDLGGEATVEEISARAKEEYPNRTLHTYVGQLLSRLEKKGLVSKSDRETWELTKRGESTEISGVAVSEVAREIDSSNLGAEGLEITNIVGTIDLNREFDLNTLSIGLSDGEYHPESSPFLVYRPIGSATLLIPTNGLVSIVGAKTPEQSIKALEAFLAKLSELGIEVSADPEEIRIQNIVAKGDLEVELDLDVLAVGIGLGRCEYEPEQFPGVVFRDEHGATVLIFRTGKYLITGAKTYATVSRVSSGLHEELRSLGIEI